MMASDIGLAALVLAMGSAAYAALASPLGLRLGQPALVASGRRAVYVTGAMMLTAFFVLFYSLASHDFGVAYVAANSSRSQPWYYTWAAMYGGQAGSLLWWATGLAITAGYHRLFSHRGYKASMPVRLFFAIFGAMASHQRCCHRRIGSAMRSGTLLWSSPQTEPRRIQPMWLYQKPFLAE